MTTHSIERTSPKGENFVGTCVLCGRPGLTSPFDGECANPAGISQDQALLDAIEGPSPEGRASLKEDGR